MDCRIKLPVFCITIILASCADVATRIEQADVLARSTGFQKSFLDVDPFRLLSYHRIRQPGWPAVIYIEGDGLAFLQRNTVSLNPTPENPVALKLALLDDSTNVIYLARPCQYITSGEDRACGSEFWTTSRYAPEVIRSMDQALEYYIKKFHIEGIRLVGYSGGGAVAALVAARRKDVIDLRTVAGNLDIEAFARYHRVTPLTGSLNPVDFAKALSTIPQIHFTSNVDDVITKTVTDSYVSAIRKYDPDLSCVSFQGIDGVSHTKGWEGVWPHYITLKGVCHR